MDVKLVTMVDLESYTASLKVIVRSEVPVSISFQGETRMGVPLDGVVTEDFYVLCIQLWEGLGKGRNFTVTVAGKDYVSGFRTIGLDSMRGFFLNAGSYPLRKGNVEVLPRDFEEKLLDDFDRDGISAFVPVREPEETEKYYNHPSVLGWILPSSLSVDELKSFQKRCFALDKTRPSALVLEKPYSMDAQILRVPDLLFFSKEAGGFEAAALYHKSYPYRCVGTLPGEGDEETRFLIIR